MTKTETPWGPAELVEEVTVRQQAGEKRFATHVQLLDRADELSGTAEHPAHPECRAADVGASRRTVAGE